MKNNSERSEDFQKISRQMQVENDLLQDYFRKSFRCNVKARPGAILVVDDVPEQASLLQRVLDRRVKEKIEVLGAESLSDVEKIIQDKGPDYFKAIVVDLSLANGEDGLDVIHWLEKCCPDVPWFINSGHPGAFEKVRDVYPDAEFLTKGVSGVEDFINVLGLHSDDSCEMAMPLDETLEQS